LLEKAKGSVNNHYLASSINYLITKKRLEMMTKKTNKLMVWAKTALSVGMCIMLCFVFSNKVIAQGEGVSDDLMKEYKTYVEKYAPKEGESVRIYKKDIDRMNEIYGAMSEEQQKSVKKLNLPPPPPTPVPPAPPTPPAPPAPVKTPKVEKAVKAPKVLKSETNEGVLPPPPPPSTPLTSDEKYFINGKSVTLEDANKALKKGVHKLKRVETEDGLEFYITTEKE
jgi:hypothetical protein